MPKARYLRRVAARGRRSTRTRHFLARPPRAPPPASSSLSASPLLTRARGTRRGRSGSQLPTSNADFQLPTPKASFRLPSLWQQSRAARRCLEGHPTSHVPDATTIPTRATAFFLRGRVRVFCASVSVSATRKAAGTWKYVTGAGSSSPRCPRPRRSSRSRSRWLPRGVIAAQLPCRAMSVQCLLALYVLVHWRDRGRQLQFATGSRGLDARRSSFCESRPEIVELEPRPGVGWESARMSR
ncbi:hypothetical protein C8Q79DRAFT_211678 [Trametes meyenii]|nr:hypothetical protein C8Q79DRAFT_211678 [Trametes meyenii]